MLLLMSTGKTLPQVGPQRKKEKGVCWECREEGERGEGEEVGREMEREVEGRKEKGKGKKVNKIVGHFIVTCIC